MDQKGMQGGLLPIPEHVAVIMDGNGRWASQHGKNRIFGHQKGVKTVKLITEAAAELGVRYLTLYAFSTENWNRPLTEVSGLMNLLVQTLKSEIKTLHKNNVRLLTIGDIAQLPEKTRVAMEEGVKTTSTNTGLNLVLALNYSARWDMTQAMQAISEKVKQGHLEPEAVNEQLINSHLSTANIPDPELLIRTSGELRISNFLLWQIAYTELYFTEILWPEFTKAHFISAIQDYRQRERRFGKTSAQLNSEQN